MTACVVWNASDGAGLSLGSWRSWYTGGVKQFGHRAGRGGDVIPAPGREKISKTREDVLSILPFSFCSLGSDIVSRTGHSALAVRVSASCLGPGATPRPGHE